MPRKLYSAAARRRAERLEKRAGATPKVTPKPEVKPGFGTLAGRPSHRNAAAPEPTRSDTTLKHGSRHGALVVNKTRMQRKTEVRTYWCDCDCGRGVFLPATEIRRRGRDNLGCLQAGCTVLDLSVRLWLEPKTAVQFQLQQLLALHPELVANEWGGTAFQGLGVATQSQAVDQLWSFVQENGDPQAGEIWLKRVDPKGFFADFNVVVGLDPEPLICKSREMYVRYGAYPVSVAQLSSDLGVDINRALLLREQADDDEQFVQSLILESATMSNKPFTAIKPGEKGFDEVDEVVSGKKKYYDYEALALYYNKAEVGTIIQLENPDPDRPLQEHNVQKVLIKRGLVTNSKDSDVPQDVLVSKPYKDGWGNTIPKEDRVVVIKKLTNTPMRLVHEH